MPLIGEQANVLWAYTFGNAPFFFSFDLDFPPRAALFKVSLGSFTEFGAQSSVELGMINMRHRLPNGSDETTIFSDIGNFDPVLTQFNNTMTHVTCGIRVQAAYGILLWSLQHWE